MKEPCIYIRIKASVLLIFLVSIPALLLGNVFTTQIKSHPQALLPDLDSWELTEEPLHYYPDTLFEYIDGAAEAYLSYDFNELVVAQYRRSTAESVVSIEIYDMGNHKNSFGIYSAERFIGSEFVSAGTQGYFEEGLLNFLIGQYYIKLLCFDCKAESDSLLRMFCVEIVSKIGDKTQFPALLMVFPKEGLVPNSEKFILKNFMGYEFFHDGYIATYNSEGLSFNCFLIEAADSKDTQNMLDQYLKIKDSTGVENIPSGFLVKDRYYDNIYIARKDTYLCGVIKIKDGFEEVGEKYLKLLIQALE